MLKLNETWIRNEASNISHSAGSKTALIENCWWRMLNGAWIVCRLHIKQCASVNYVKKT